MTKNCTVIRGHKGCEKLWVEFVPTFDGFAGTSGNNCPAPNSDGGVTEAEFGSHVSKGQIVACLECLQVCLCCVGKMGFINGLMEADFAR